MTDEPTGPDVEKRPDPGTGDGEEQNSVIIIVEDSEDELLIAKRMYAKSVLTDELVAFTSGLEVLEYLDGYDPTVDPMIRLILMDINMPGMNGIEAVAEIRRRPEFNEVPIITMLTSSADPRDRERSSEVGANDYYIKPMRAKDFVDFFNSFADPE